MRTTVTILIAVIFIGCIKDEPIKSFTAHQVIQDNVFIYGSVQVKVNPNLDYLKISGSVEKEKFGITNDPTKREFHIFTRPGINKIVLIETHTRNHPHTFQQPRANLTKNMAVIQKGTKPIAGQTWEIYIRALPVFPEQIFNAVRQKEIRIEPYGCGLEIGVAKGIDRFGRIFVSYIKGINECATLPQNGEPLNDEQIRLIREFANQFDENVTISYHSGG